MILQRKCLNKVFISLTNLGLFGAFYISVDSKEVEFFNYLKHSCLTKEAGAAIFSTSVLTHLLNCLELGLWKFLVCQT